jgi:hypothetical protein
MDRAGLSPTSEENHWCAVSCATTCGGRSGLTHTIVGYSSPAPARRPRRRRCTCSRDTARSAPRTCAALGRLHRRRPAARGGRPSRPRPRTTGCGTRTTRWTTSNRPASRAKSRTATARPVTRADVGAAGEHLHPLRFRDLHIEVGHRGRPGLELLGGRIERPLRPAPREQREEGRAPASSGRACSRGRARPPPARSARPAGRRRVAAQGCSARDGRRSGRSHGRARTRPVTSRGRPSGSRRSRPPGRTPAGSRALPEARAARGSRSVPPRGRRPRSRPRTRPRRYASGLPRSSARQSARRLRRKSLRSSPLACS